MFEHPTKHGEGAVLVHLSLASDQEQESLSEFKELVRSAGLTCLAVVNGRRHAAHPKTFAGKGKVEEIRMLVQNLGAEVVLFNHTLSPSQERNLERELNCRVIDRTGLILDIFAQRARSFEGKLQVELAQLKHLSTRLIRGWTHLERQKGGIGLRGPGETQLETDRRLITQRIKQLHSRLKKVRDQRHLGRNARQRSEVGSVSLVGYTNAGKSTLFNHLTGASVYAADQLFATLDSTIRRLDAATDQDIVLSDTVGFIRHLPHDLVVAFRSTLEETRQADLLLHVVDASDPEKEAYTEQVNQVLQEIGAGSIPVLMVFNKIDLTEIEPHVEYDAQGRPVSVWVSALENQGIDLLKQAVLDHTLGGRRKLWINLPAAGGRIRAKLYAMGVVEKERLDQDNRWNILVCISHKDLDAITRAGGELVELVDQLPESLARQRHAS